MKGFAQYGAGTSLYFGFSAPELSMKNITKFCSSVMRMSHPQIEEYWKNSKSTMLIIEDNKGSMVKYVRIGQHEKNHTRITIGVMSKDDDIDTGTFIFEAVSIPTFLNMVVHSDAGQTVYVYTIDRNHTIKMKRLAYGTYGIEGVVNHGYSPYKGRRPQHMTWVNSELFIRDSLHHVWFYERHDELAKKLLLGAFTRRERYRRAKEVMKSARRPPRRDERKNTTQMHNLFEHCAGDKRIATRLTRTLIRAFGIYNLSDLRERAPKPEELIGCRHIGEKSLDAYRKAYDLIHKLPNC